MYHVYMYACICMYMYVFIEKKIVNIGPKYMQTYTYINIIAYTWP